MPPLVHNLYECQVRANRYFCWRVSLHQPLIHFRYIHDAVSLSHSSCSRSVGRSRFPTLFTTLWHLACRGGSYGIASIIYVTITSYTCSERQTKPAKPSTTLSTSNKRLHKCHLSVFSATALTSTGETANVSQS